MSKHPKKPFLESDEEFALRLQMFHDSEWFSRAHPPSTKSTPVVAREKSLPVPMIRYIQVQTHSRCNADCIFCPYAESWHAEHPGRMSDTLWQKTLHDLAPFAQGINQGKFLPYLMQEPLLDPSIFDKIEEIYTHFPNTCLELSTNGTVLTTKVVDQLIKIFSAPHHKHQLWISHHGINQDTFEHIMKLDYQHALHNLIELLKKAKGRLRIRLRGFGTRRDGKHVFFTSQQYRNYWQQILEHHGIAEDNIQIDAYTYHDRAATLTRSDRGANQLNMSIMRKIGPQNRFYCPRIDLWIHIMWDGQIRLCCMDYHGEVPLPNLHDMSLLEYFASPAYQQIYEMVTGKQNSDAHFICKRCSSPGG